MELLALFFHHNLSSGRRKRREVVDIRKSLWISSSWQLSAARGCACTIHGQQDGDIVYCSQTGLWWSTGRTRMSQAPGSPAGAGAASLLRLPDPTRTLHFSPRSHYCLWLNPRFLSRTFWTGIQTPSPKWKEKNSSFNSSTRQNWQIFLQWKLS